MLLKVPLAKTVTTTLTVTLAPGLIVNPVQVTVWPETLASGSLETYLNASFNTSVILALWATPSPLLVTTMVKVTLSPM